MDNSLMVPLGDRSYPIHFGAGLETLAASAGVRVNGSSDGDRDAVVIDQALLSLHAGVRSFFAGLPTLALPAGEKSKSLGTFGQVLDFLAAQGIGRAGRLWVVGGGVIGDLGGFAAASYLRGIAYVQVPTTLLAMVDSSVGGKTGVNLTAGKNLVGAFHHPRQVLICTDFLPTLPPREFAAGLAEVIKYGLLGDGALFEAMEKSPLTPLHPQLTATIRRCCAIKAAIVAADERETARDGGRALLNLGHTFAHAIEQATDFSAYLHGEAVAVGLAGAARLSARLGFLSAADVARVERVVAAHALPVRLRSPLPTGALMRAMLHDKKARAGRLRFVVLPRLGEAATREDIEAGTVEAVWRELGAI